MSIIFWFAFSYLFDSSAPCTSTYTGGGLNGRGQTGGGQTGRSQTGGSQTGGSHTGQRDIPDKPTRPTGPPKYIKGEGVPNPDFWQAPPGMTKEDIQKNIVVERDKIKEYEKQLEAEEAEFEAKMNDPKYAHLSSDEREQLKRKIRIPKDADEDWPEGWSDLGYAYTGNAPPEHAKVPQGAGKAGICFMPPVIGKCKDFEFRYGYNPYTEICERFVYSGCGGNANIFYTMKRCKEVCEGPTLPTCLGTGSTTTSSNTTTPMMDINWLEIPTIPTNTDVIYTTSSTTTTTTTAAPAS